MGREQNRAKEGDDVSNVKARLMKPTGVEWMDIPFSLAGAVWNFIRHEYKNKSSVEAKPGTRNSERGMGDIPKRYWETHAVPLHKLSRKIIRQCRKAFQAFPISPESVAKRKKHMKKAMDLCYAMFDEIRLTLNELPGVDANKFNEINDLLNKEIDALKTGRKNTQLLNHGQNGPNKPENPTP